MKKFALIGVGGYIAPRHLKAIKDTENTVVAAYDIFDSVGVIDSYFPSCSFFTEFELFDRYISKKLLEGDKLDYVSVCTPNYLHDAHVRYGLRQGCDVICEKPIVLNPWNIKALEGMEQLTGKNVYTILQLRRHHTIIALKNRIDNGDPNKIYDIDLSYITSRGNWYYTSWKGDIQKSGGVATNIGVHFYDMLSWIFGEVEENIVHVASHDRVAGFLRLKKARIRYFLSINEDTLPVAVKKANKRTFRSLQIDGEEIEFSDGFTELHTDSYSQILKGNGFRVSEARRSVEIVHDIRHACTKGLVGDYHPFAKLPLSAHPFSR